MAATQYKNVGMFAINKEFDHLFVWDFLECDQFYVKKIGSEAGKI